MGLIQTVIGMVDLSSFRHGYFLCALRILWLSLFAQVLFFSKHCLETALSMSLLFHCYV